jgi:hypothetical protein
MAVRVEGSPAAALSAVRVLVLGATAAIALAACGSAVATLVPSASGSPPSSGATASAAPGLASASPSAAEPSEPSPSTGGSASLLLEVRHEGGFINPAATIGASSAVVVDTDGRIYTRHVNSDWSTPLIPRIDVRDTGISGAAAVLAAARDAGLDAGGSAGVAGDSGSTVFTLETPDGSEVVTRVGAMGPGVPGVPGGSGDASAVPGAPALALLARLTDTAAPWPSSSAPARAFEPTAYEIWVAPDAAGGVGAATVNWPLTTDPNQFGAPVASDHGVAGLRSGEVSGDQAAVMATALGSMAANSDLAHQGHAYRVWVRPMLPDEFGS